jgi:hypothetical protein
MSKIDFSQLSAEALALEEVALKERLAMNPEERIEAHENARRLLEDLKKAGEELRAKSQRTS